MRRSRAVDVGPRAGELSDSMPNLLAMSFEGEIAPSFNLRCARLHNTLPDGWGVGYYPAGEPSAAVLKEPAPGPGSIRQELIKAWDHLESSLFVLHVRAATWGPNTDANTQPFAKSWGAREWLIGHAGSLTRAINVPTNSVFEPVGSTDTERVFCVLLGRLAERGWRSLAEVDLGVFSEWLAELNALGTLDLALCDGRDLLVYADLHTAPRLHMGELLPPFDGLVVSDADVQIDFTSRQGTTERKGIVVSSSPLECTGKAARENWRVLEQGEIVVVRQGAVFRRWMARGDSTNGAPGDRPASRVGRREAAGGTARRLRIMHRTTYAYGWPVERSTHLLRLVPVHDRLQNVELSEISLSVEGRARDFDDVFGNRVRRVAIDTPYQELTITARSETALLDTDPLAFANRRVRTTIPLVWMPWQRIMLEPFLLPPELPETHLAELADYAMRYVARNDGDLLDTLLDLNDSIFREYAYSQGATTLSTTPFDVYVSKRGVCQDFAHLFICLARLMSVPARYVCGYLYTGPKDHNRAQAEASHAWVQVYLPEIGWRGFDPTNGVVTSTSHVRIAVGRNYVDATPTSGTIYVGGGNERLSVDVIVDPID
jgi:transglutaminase-like putative cysteine protease/predicted glutamine amidotransferase